MKLKLDLARHRSNCKSWFDEKKIMPKPGHFAVLQWLFRLTKNSHITFTDLERVLAAFRRIPDSNIARHVSSEVHLFLIAAWDWLSVCRRTRTAWRDGYWWWGNLSPCKFSGKSEVRDPPLHRFTKLLVWGCKLFHPMWYSTFAVLAGSSLQDLPALNVELCTIEPQNYAASSIHEFIKNITYSCSWA